MLSSLERTRVEELICKNSLPRGFLFPLFMVCDIEKGRAFLCYCYRNEIHAAVAQLAMYVEMELLVSALRPRLIKEVRRGGLVALAVCLNDRH
jgi:hypothetical protein